MSLEELWNTYHGRVMRYFGTAMRIRWGQDTVNDLVSTVFLQASVAIKNGNGYTVDSERWIITIARNVLKDHFRKQKHTIFVSWDDLEIEPSREPSPHEMAEASLLEERLNKVLDRLSPLQREAFILRLQGYEAKDMAEILETNPMAAKQVSWRAYTNVCKWLNEAA
jgi:RNA polymerase sigma factor (sigma-70 family)